MTMTAKLKRMHSPDVDLHNFWPDDPKCFGFLLQFFAGTEKEEGDDAFSIMVCTPRWFEREKSSPIVFGANYLIVAEYDLVAIEEFLRRYCERCSGESWFEVAAKIGRVAHWEFEDYTRS